MPTHQHTRAYLTADQAEEILRRIMNGESLLRICGPDRGSDMPDRFTVHRRVRSDPVFRMAYFLAREAQAEVLAQEALDIADGRMTPQGQVPNVGRDWLRVHTRRWLAGVMSPRAYGKLSARDELHALEAQTRSRVEIMEEVTGLLEEMRERWAVGGAGEAEVGLLGDLRGEREGVG